jgi:hypothetical protein
MKTITVTALLTLYVIANLTSCKEKINNEDELITTVKIKLTKQDSTNSKTYVWRDIDGPGGNAPDKNDTILIDSGFIYNASIEFWNESSGKNQDITQEIKTESKDHLVCLKPSVENILLTESTDSDGQYPIGLDSKWTILKKAKATIRINLRHQPGIKNGTCEPGDSDVDVIFPLTLQ